MIAPFSALLAAALSSAAPVPGGHSPHIVAAAAMDTLRGTVTDTAGAPLAGVEVTVVELERKTRTGSGGEFAFAGLPAGRYTLAARRQGYAAAIRTLSTREGGDLRVALTESPIELEGVTVTAGRTAAAGGSVLSTATVGPERIRQEHSVSLAHTLESVPGVRTLSTGEQIGKPVIRGFSGSRVLVLADGLRLEDYSWSDEDAPSVDARLAQRVEVVRGPASLLYGSDAEGGVVNVIPEALPDALGRTGYTRGGVETYFSTGNTEGGLVLHGEGARGAFGWRVVGIGRLAEDYRTPGGKVENTGFGAFNGELAGGLRGGWGSVTARYDRYGGEFKLLEADKPVTAPGAGEKEGGPERKLADDRLQVAAVLPWRGLRVEPRAQLQRHSLIEVADEVNGTTQPGAESVQFDLLLNTFTFDLLAHHGDAEGTGGTFGVSGVAQSNDTRGPVPLVPDAGIRTGAVFAFQQVQMGRVRLLAGARGDARKVDADANATLGLADDSRSYRALTFNAGAVVDVAGGLSVRGNVGRAWRAPTLFELFANGPRLGEARFDIGDPTLGTEQNLSAEVGLRWAGARVQAEVEAFGNRVDDYLVARPTAQTQQGLRVFRYAATDARLWGGEGSVQVQPVRSLLLRAAADYVRGEDRTLDEPLPLMPPARALLRAELRPELSGTLRGASLWAQVQAVAHQGRPAPEELAPDGYTLLDLGGGFRPRLGRRVVAVDLQVHNLLDTSYRDFLSRYKEFADNPGRSLTLRLATDF
ncbi:MAG TPA: TonB-dependent receptor [Longimicrobiaceae bacterium]|nr:TonB-dependent receptor [Longimicrobiaceae bacterium]